MDDIRLGSRTLQPGRQLLVNGRREPIGKRALDILSALAEAGGGIVTKEELFEAVWPGVTVEENALQVHIVALRKALGPEADRLQTIRGVGYQLAIDGVANVPAPEAVQSLPVDPSPPSVSTPSVPDRVPTPSLSLTALAAWPRRHRWATALAALLLVLASGWILFGDDLGMRPQERIPVVVRALTPGPAGAETEASLASGITDELIFRLRRIPELRVATAAANGMAPSDAFANAYVVDGSIRRSGDQLRVAVRLADADGEILWFDSFDRTVSDLFDMQEEIAAAIAGALSVSFDVGVNAAKYGGTDNPDAYAAYVQYLAHQRDFDQRVPLGHLERAVALDPQFGKANSALAISYGGRISSAATTAQAEGLLARMDRASARALEANPDRWFGSAARGWYFLARRDFQSAERQMRRVAELDPGDDPELRSQLATYASHLGRLKEANSISESREAIDPIYRNSPEKVGYLMMAARYREAIALSHMLERYDERDGQGFVFDTYFSYLLSGQEAEAEAFAQEGNYPFAGRRRQLMANKALPSMSREQLREWAEREGRATQPGLSATALYAGYEGHDRLAVELLAVAYERPGGSFLRLLWHPALANARKTDAFEQLVTELGLVKVWRESGDWGDYCRPVNATEITCT